MDGNVAAGTCVFVQGPLEQAFKAIVMLLACVHLGLVRKIVGTKAYLAEELVEISEVFIAQNFGALVLWSLLLALATLFDDLVTTADL